MDQQQTLKEVEKCRKSPAYFANTYCKVFDAEAKAWVPFSLWPRQAETLAELHEHKRLVVLKARQLGLTWLVLSYALWLMLFKRRSQIGLWSLREKESSELLQTRLLGMYQELPEWMRTGGTGVKRQNGLELMLRNGSRAVAFPANRADSYSFSLAIIDEADLIPDLDTLLAKVGPTIDAGSSKLVLLSRADKSAPESAFKKIFTAARRGENSYRGVFLPWDARPDRDAAWYETVRRDSLAQTGSLDLVHEQYPASEAEALAPRSMDKRISSDWLVKCYVEARPVECDLVLPGLRVYVTPVAGSKYVIGADPAQGNPNSDDSALVVMDSLSGEEVATLAGKVEPSVFGSYIEKVSLFYGKAPAMVERNHHGWAVLQWLRDNTHVRLLCGSDGKYGWLTLSRSKAMMYSDVSDVLRERAAILHDLQTFQQLCSIEGSTLSAPSGQHDDLAMAFGLAVVASGKVPQSSGVIVPAEGIPRIAPRSLFGPVSGVPATVAAPVAFGVPKRGRAYRLFGAKR